MQLFRLLCVVVLFTIGGNNFALSEDKINEHWDAGLDLPIMDGLTEVPNTRVEFDKPGGKIVEVVYWAEDMPYTSILMFYMKTAPQLGWRPIPVPQWPASFIRDGEMLTIGQDHKTSEKTLKNKGLFVPFSIQPEKK